MSKVLPQARPPRRAAPLNALLAVCVTVFVIWAAYDVLMPLALSSLLAFLLAPIVSRLERYGLPQVWAVLATVTVTFSAIAGMAYVVGTQVYTLAVALPNYTTEIEKKAGQIKGMFTGGIGERIAALGDKIEQAKVDPASRPVASTQSSPFGAAAEQIRDNPVAAVAGPDVPTAARTSSTQPAGATPENPIYAVALPAPLKPIELLSRYLGTILGPLGTAGLVVVFTIFVLLEREQLRDRMIRLVSGGNYTVTTAAITDATRRISRYVLAQSIVNGSYGLIVGIGLWLIGLIFSTGHGFPSFVLWGLLCATLRFIPYIGPWAASAFPIALSLAVYDGFTVFAVVLAMFIVIELLSNNVMEPWLYGSSTGLSTVAILVAAVFWTWLWGPIGLLLSTPLTVCIVVLGRYTTQLKFLDVLLSDREALPPHVRFYQRLLAGDEREALEIVRVAAGETDWSRASDAVVVPALTLARRDRRDEHMTADDEARVLAAIANVNAEVARKLADAAHKHAGDAPPDAATAAARPTIFAVPAHHRSEEAALGWLPIGPVLAPVRVELGSTRTLGARVIERVATERPAAVVIGVVPPGGLAQARYLCRRIRRRVPTVPIVVVYFGRPRHFDKLLGRLRAAGASYVTTSVEQTQRQILAVTIDRGPAAAAAVATPQAVSTPSELPPPGEEQR